MTNDAKRHILMCELSDKLKECFKIIEKINSISESEILAKIETSNGVFVLTATFEEIKNN